ncbi:MAG: Fic family protein [Alphaproteobacteria bacterium]|nr:Fic family protein [Alphaproteobacteria bacterium]MBO6629527.1 Fic family protein [Alphaproteobacteria bacterium]MDF1625798.1 Fic family protein [Parvibaculaceae bacterium]|tara:strand:+ start:716 stop:1822 length:1107 start_codon:yes stop_codon:yes gene_type:complete
MKWNWQQKDWPDFAYEHSALRELEAQFLLNSGVLVGAFMHLTQEDKDQLTVDLISNEALKTSEIEGEYLNRDSLQSSIRNHLGLAVESAKASPAERGISEMMIDLYRSFNEPMSAKMLHRWHKMLMQGRHDLADIGAYRTHEEAMQVVSGPSYKRKVHFEAPPSLQVPAEMERFIAWFNAHQGKRAATLTPLVRAGISHLYFESIHPYEDGNGRIGRAISEKSLSQSQGRPTLLALSHTIERRRKRYYEALEAANKSNEVTEWLLYFAEMVLEAQSYTHQRIEFIIQKTKFYDRYRGQFNKRQEKAIARIFREGPDGFTGGLSAENYISITKTSRTTATRDLSDLVTKGAFSRTGELKGTRYHLAMAE